MDTSRLMLFISGNMRTREKQNCNKQNLPRFYKDNDETDQGETIFCKNNVCVFNDKHIPGYLTLKACTVNDEYTRLILHWTSNALLQESYVTDDQMRPVTGNEDSDSYLLPGVFHIDLTEMKSLKFFFQEDETSGHFVVGNHENHYKVFHFDLGGMNHLVEIFENWSLCKEMQLPIEERPRKRAFVIGPIYSILPNQSFEESRYFPMTKARWKGFLNKAGQLEDVSNFRKEVFFGGVFPEVRNEVWPFLLHYYPFHSRMTDRKNIKEQKMKEYSELNQKRLNMPKDEYDKFWLNVQCTVDKDVVRTDRSHPYFAGNDNPNVEIMRQILLNYAYYHPEIGYNQGMSDLLASILCTVQDEVDSFWCFVGLMEKSLFVTSPKDDSMDCQLLYLKELLRMMAAKFYAHLLLEDEGMDLLFCHRWLLLGFKREFYDIHVMRMWEACWSHYQTEFFHIFICVAIVLEYGDLVWQKSMRVDEMLNYFNNLALEMDGDKVLKRARRLLYQFRKLAGIPCTLRGLLSGPGAWDSATLPEIECTCHETRTCKYLNLASRRKNFSQEHKKISNERESDERNLEEHEMNGKENDSNGSLKLASETLHEKQGDVVTMEMDIKSNKLKGKERKDNGQLNVNGEVAQPSSLNEQNNDELKTDEQGELSAILNDEIADAIPTTYSSDLVEPMNDELRSDEQQRNETRHSKYEIPKDKQVKAISDLTGEMKDEFRSEEQQNEDESENLKNTIPGEHKLDFDEDK